KGDEDRGVGKEVRLGDHRIYDTKYEILVGGHGGICGMGRIRLVGAKERNRGQLALVAGLVEIWYPPHVLAQLGGHDSPAVLQWIAYRAPRIVGPVLPQSADVVFPGDAGFTQCFRDVRYGLGRYSKLMHLRVDQGAVGVIGSTVIVDQIVMTRCAVG